MIWNWIKSRKHIDNKETEIQVIEHHGTCDQHQEEVTIEENPLKKRLKSHNI